MDTVAASMKNRKSLVNYLCKMLFTRMQLLQDMSTISTNLKLCPLGKICARLLSLMFMPTRQYFTSNGTTPVEISVTLDMLRPSDSCSLVCLCAAHVYAIILGYAKIKALQHAFDLYLKIQENHIRCLTSYTLVALLKLCTDMKDVERTEVLICFEQIQEKSVLLNAFTYVCILKAFGNLKDVGKGKDMQIEIVKNGMLEDGAFVGSIVVDMYCKCGAFADAQEAFKKVLVKDVMSWTTLIARYAEHGCVQDALDGLKQMQQHVSPNSFTFVSLLHACNSVGITRQGQEIHNCVANVGLERDPIINNNLIDMFVKCSSLAKAQVKFECSPVRDGVSWTTSMTGSAQIGEASNIFHTFDRMIGMGVNPDVLTFCILLNACSHTRLLEMAQAYFSASRRYYDFVPTLQHYNCIIDLLGRADHIDKAVVWHTVLSACQKWGDVELGKRAFKNAVYLDVEDAGAFVCMSNIYASTAM